MNGVYNHTLWPGAGPSDPVQRRAPARERTSENPDVDAPSSRWNSRVIPAVVLLIGVVLSFTISQSAREETRRHAELRFDSDANNAAVQVERRFAAYFEVLSGVRALFHTGEVSREDFHRYAEALALKRNYPGFEVLNYAPYVAAATKEAFEATVRRDPSLPHGVRFAINPPGARDSYLPLTFI